MKSILKSYQRRLLNLSSNNRALLLLRLYKEMHLDVQELDFLINSPAFSIVQHLIAGKKRIIISPYADSRYAPVAPVSRRLRQIRRREDMIFEERGSRELYVGWPFVHGKFPDGTVVRSPLLFFPVRLQVNAAQEWELETDTSQAPHFNQSFLLAYAHYTGTGLAEPLMDLDLTTLPKDPLAFRTAIYELLKENQLQVHAGREFFADRLKNFRDVKRAEFEEDLKPGQLYLEQEAVLGIFAQAASFLLADYDELLGRENLNGMEDLFEHTSSDAPTANAQAQQTFTAFPIDASQEAALRQVKQGKSLVVQGPPGTGKSQLICNLVSDFTARGKKVLVVSQKRAALDVVHQRLSSLGLGTFTALVHDIHADRRAIYTQLQRQIEQVEEYRRQNLALDSIYTDRTFLEVCRGINRCTQKLEAFKHALFDTSRCGWSPKELYLQSSLAQPHLALPPTFRHFTAATIPDFLPRLRQYLQLAVVATQEAFLLKDRRSFKGWGWPERQQLQQTIIHAPEQYKQLQQSISALSGYTFHPDNLPRYTAAQPTLEALQAHLQQQDVMATFLKLQQTHAKPEELKAQLKQLRELYLVCPSPDATLPAAMLPEVETALAAYEQQRGQLLKSISWAFSPEKKTLKQALALYNWELNEIDVARLQRRLELRQQTEKLMQQVNQSTGYALKIEDLPTPILHKLDVAEEALKAQELLAKLHQNKVLSEKLLSTTSLPEHLNALSQSINTFRAKYSNWLQWMPEAQLQRVVAEPAHCDALLAELQQHFEPLVAHDTLYSSFTEAEREMAAALLTGKLEEADEVEKLFLNSLYLAWLHELEQQHPELRMPSSGELETLEKELQRLLLEKNRLSQEIVLSQLREQTYRHLEYNRLGNAVTYRRLHAQVVKKRSLYPIRKLFSQFSDEILDLVPCWLASPETVSAVTPLQQCFDLVIFDEASQTFAETGIPSVVRGKQVVVAGDEQQLQPSDLYRARWNPEDEEAEELIAESLLRLCSLYLPQTMLLQHYRSRYPELIDFSNRHFYHQKLELIPDRQDVNASKPAIAYRQVQGLWQDNTNAPEAEAVVNLVLDLLKAGQADVGVITFNYPQQMLVQDLLEEAAQQQSINLPSSLIIKNIENMQGDEKEVIILSVGYAPDRKGRFAMQFGSLSQAGGENRLNVAITRAKLQVIVVSSISPEELQVEQALHAGPKLLKAYLSFARQVSKGEFTFTPKQGFIPKGIRLLKNTLEEQDENLKQKVPFADLTVVEQGKYKGVVLTDDDLYYSQLSVNHSHADVPQLLQSRHWPYLKVYSRQFWENKEAVLGKVRAFRS
ncbi:AAA domain-containing protein [Pontibacter ruber]|uniref:AAA domain-containing protein n=1 Tax=Pontibacter ruber TaxID=1343895 RepID=A0ABW5CXS3_9BACT|nr:AAA domain-containing protein [Pontibacter ruber]